MFTEDIAGERAYYSLMVMGAPCTYTEKLENTCRL